MNFDLTMKMSLSLISLYLIMSYTRVINTLPDIQWSDRYHIALKVKILKSLYPISFSNHMATSLWH